MHVRQGCGVCPLQTEGDRGMPVLQLRFYVIMEAFLPFTLDSGFVSEHDEPSGCRGNTV